MKVSSSPSVNEDMASKAEKFSILRYLEGNFVTASLVVYTLLVATGELGLYIFFHFNTSPAVIWPPVGIALAAMLLFGYQMWIPIAFARLTLNALSPGNPGLLIDLITVVVYTVQPLLGTYILRRFHFNNSLERARDTLLFVAISLILSAIAPLMITAAQWMNGATFADLSLSFTRAWAGGILSIMILTPLIITWLSRRQLIYTSRRGLEPRAALAMLVAITYLTFWTKVAQAYSFLVLYLLFGILFWIGLRMGPRLMALALFIMSSLGVLGTLLVHPGDKTIAEQLLADQLFVILFAPFFTVLASVVVERIKDALALEVYSRDLEDALDKLALQDVAKNEFIAILGHELRNPLAPVVSTLELLRLRNQENAESLKLIEKAELQTHTMRRLLDDLLDIARVTQGKFDLKKERVALREMIRHSVDVVQPFMEGRGHTLTTTFSGAPKSLTVDSVRFEQIVTNLLNNAAKYTPRGGHINLTCSQERDELVMRVQDNGIGIAQESLKYVFEPFKQVSLDADKRETGLGIGLAITKRLVELHGGTIDVVSALGSGSTFTVRIPLTKTDGIPSPVIPAKSRSRTKKIDSQSLKILVVDDNEEAATGLGKLLEYHGHVVRLCHTGIDALSEGDIFRPDAILLDIGLPDMDGYEVARRLRENRISSKLIALTGFGQGHDKTLAKEVGFDHYLIKPARVADITALLRHA